MQMDGAPLRMESPYSFAPSGDTTYLGLELAPDQLRAVLVDDTQELIGTWVVDFDADLAEYGTRGGMYTGDSQQEEPYTAPVEMWVRALDLLFELLVSSTNVDKIGAISGCALPSLVWWKSTPLPSLASLDPARPLSTWFTKSAFSLPNTSVRGERTREVMARVSAQPQREAWVRTGRVQAASKFVESLVAGRWAGIGEAEAWASGMYNADKARWDEDVLDAVGGSREEGRRVRGWLGEVTQAGGEGKVSRYLVERYGFSPGAIVYPFTLDVLATYASLNPARDDAVLAFGPTDTCIVEVDRGWVESHPASTELVVVPHPWQRAAEERRYLALIQAPNADVARALVRDMYTKSWSAFDRLVAIVPPGGSIGLDDKLFAFWSLPTITRFETGLVVNEFRDLRANPRCLVESQIIAMRVKWGRAVAEGAFGPICAKEKQKEINMVPMGGMNPPGALPASRYPPGSLTLPPLLPFDPISSHLPARLLCVGAAANFPSVANVLCDVFGRRVYVAMSQIDSAQISPHRNAPARGFPGRAAYGSALVARWAAAPAIATLKSTSRGPFEAAVHAVHAARWERSGGTWARTNVSVSTPSHAPSTPHAGYMTPTLVDPDQLAQGTTALVPISALPVVYPANLRASAEADLDLAQSGLARVADADHDAFLGYASVIGEWVRLEGVVRRG